MLNVLLIAYSLKASVDWKVANPQISRAKNVNITVRTIPSSVDVTLKQKGKDYFHRIYLLVPEKGYLEGRQAYKFRGIEEVLESRDVEVIRSLVCETA